MSLFQFSENLLSLLLFFGRWLGRLFLLRWAKTCIWMLHHKQHTQPTQTSWNRRSPTLISLTVSSMSSVQSVILIAFKFYPSAVNKAFLDNLLAIWRFSWITALDYYENKRLHRSFSMLTWVPPDCDNKIENSCSSRNCELGCDKQSLWEPSVGQRALRTTECQLQKRALLLKGFRVKCKYLRATRTAGFL